MPERTRALLRIDMRAAIARGHHPLTDVMRAAADLEPGGMLELVTSFEPEALCAQLTEAGWQLRVSAGAEGSWLVHAGRPTVAAIADYTELPPPEPLERVLAAAAALPPGGVHVAHLPRDPVPAKPHLEARGLSWQVALRPDGSALLWVRR